MPIPAFSFPAREMVGSSRTTMSLPVGAFIRHPCRAPSRPGSIWSANLAPSPTDVARSRLITPHGGTAGHPAMHAINAHHPSARSTCSTPPRNRIIGPHQRTQSFFLPGAAASVCAAVSSPARARQFGRR